MISIREIVNGYILNEGNGFETHFDNLADLLRTINMLYSTESRHSKKRIYITEAPGDKHPDFTDKHADVLWSDLDD